MTKDVKALLELVRVGVTDDCSFSEALYNADWKQLVELAGQHGVAALAMEGLEQLHKHKVSLCPLEQKLQLYAMKEQTKKAAAAKREQTVEFLERLEMPCIVMKGMDYARFWPKEEWRGFGDLDIFAIGEAKVQDCSREFKVVQDGSKLSHVKLYKLANDRCREIGCNVEDDGYYKHSHVRYKQLMVENHLYLTMHDDTKNGRFLEKELQRMMVEGEKTPLTGCGLSPCRDFTAIFLLIHAHQHFFYEGFSLKLVMDWYFFLREEGKKVNWKEVQPVLEKSGVLGFYEVMTGFCEKWLGLVQGGSSADAVQGGSKLLDAFTEAVFEKPVVGSKAKELVCRFKRMWSFRQFLGASILVRIKNTLVFNFLNKQPTLE